VTGRIVVGVDGSEGSACALQWALDEAARRHARLDVVHVWNYPWVVAPRGRRRPGWDARNVAVAREVLADATRTVPVGPDAVDARRILGEGPAAEVLLRAAVGADLLVVGSRGRGGFVGLLLGSVSHQCAQHSGSAAG
jgi:nucleotide-binding universal stress UspA family protein